MTRAEILVYNLGRRLHAEMVDLTASGHGDDLPPSAVLTAEETASAQLLGPAKTLRWMRLGATDQAVSAPRAEGGRELPVTAERMAVPPFARPAT